jgi:arsenate reductase (thioredoxin)
VKLARRLRSTQPNCGGDSMGCGDACPIFVGTRYQDRDLDNLSGLSVAAVRPIRDEIERRVRVLLDVPAAR